MLKSNLLACKNLRKHAAEILSLPSKKELFFTTRYKSIVAFSSQLDKNRFPQILFLLKQLNFENFDPFLSKYLRIKIYRFTIQFAKVSTYRNLHRLLRKPASFPKIHFSFSIQRILSGRSDFNKVAKEVFIDGGLM